MTTPTHTPDEPHQGQPILSAGEPLEQAQAALVLLHGRGASAQDILTLVPELFPEGLENSGLAVLAPQAAGGTWYPNRFMEPTQTNEPWLSSALRVVGDLLAHISQAGIPLERTVLLGFSQGGCLALEYAARNARRYGSLIGLSAGLIGAEGEPRQDHGSLQGTPVFLGCSDPDLHIPRSRVEESARILGSLGGKVTLRLYPDLGHTINQDEIEFVRRMLAEVTV